MKQLKSFMFLNRTVIMFGGLALIYLAVLISQLCKNGVTPFHINRLIIFSCFYLLIVLILVFITVKHPKEPLLDELFRYRYTIAILCFIIFVAFEISGSSISVWDDYYLADSEVEEHTLYGIPRTIRSDEWAVNTPLLLSQYENKTGKFPYFSDTIRGTQTDTFIIYGQPVLDISIIFRPFHWGYLFLPQGQGLSFFWMGRLIALFLVTLELSMLITKRNKPLSMMSAVLVTLAPTIQWWFAINGLVEMLVFGQLAILLIYHYMNTGQLWRRCLYSAILAICGGGYILTFYPAWQIPIFYIFLAIGIWVVVSNYHKGIFSKKDLRALLVFLIIFGGGLAYVLSKSFPTIMASVNTAYPGGRFETGGNIGKRFFQYIGNIFFPYQESGILTNVCDEAVFFDFFPLGLIFALITLIKQKKKDVFLISLLVVTVFLSLWCVVSWPEWLAKITLLSTAPAGRVHAVLGFANILLLVRALALGEVRVKAPLAAALAVLYSTIVLFIAKQVYGEYYTEEYIAISFVVLVSLSLLLFLYQNKKVQSILAGCSLGLALIMGAAVNPVEQGVGALIEQPVVKEIQEIVKADDGLWIVEGLSLPFDNIPITAGAPTINSTNVYPYLERWEMFDEEGKYAESYNRYAHITIKLQNARETSFITQSYDLFAINLNINDLYKLDADYILTQNDLGEFNSGDIKFECISSVQGFCIYKILYGTQ